MAVSTIKGANYQGLSPSDFIAFNSGFFCSDTAVHIVIQGNVLYGRFILNNANAVTANARYAIGTIKNPYRPRVICAISGAGYHGLIGTDGVIYAVPNENKSANGADNITFSYII